MVIKLYISGISGNKEVKKKQQRVQMILDSKQINYEAIDITEPGREKDKEFMQQNGKVRENLGKYPLPPQIFNDDDFCGDYEDFDMANEVDELEKFLHIETNSKELEISSKVNGLQEEIISTNDLVEENEQNEEMKKNKVNGESEIIPAVKPSSESITETVETSGDDVLAPQKEESPMKETAFKEKSEENLADNQEHKIETQDEERKVIDDIEDKGKIEIEGDKEIDYDLPKSEPYHRRFLKEMRVKTEIRGRSNEEKKEKKKKEEAEDHGKDEDQKERKGF